MADENGASRSAVDVDSQNRAPRRIRIESTTPVEPADEVRYAGSFRLRYLGDGSTIRKTSRDDKEPEGTVIHLSVTRSLEAGATAGRTEESRLQFEGIVYTLTNVVSTEKTRLLGSSFRSDDCRYQTAYWEFNSY